MRRDTVLRWVGIPIPRLLVLVIVILLPIVVEAVAHIEVWGLLSETDPGRAAAEQKVVDSFNALYEGRIVARAVGFDGRVDDKVLTAVAGGAPPAVARISRVTMGAYAAQGVVQSLQHYIDRDGLDPSVYFPGPWQETIFLGESYALPAWTDVRAVSFNRRLFREAGLEEQVPSTWDTIQIASRKLLRGESGQWTQIGFVPHWGNWKFPGWVWAAGGEILDAENRVVTWDGPEGLLALEWLVAFSNEQYGGIQTIEAWGSAVSRPFDNERQAMAIHPSDSPAKIRRRNPDIEIGVGCVPRPAGLEETPTSWSGGFGWVMPTGADHPDAAWEFINYASSESVQKHLGVTLERLPTNIRAARSPDFLAQDEIWPFLTSLMNYSRFRPVCPGTRAGVEQCVDTTRVQKGRHEAISGT